MTKGSTTKWRLAIIEISAALVTGTLLYMLARPRGLIAFGWVDAAGMGGALTAARATVLPYANALPGFVRFSLPDGLWGSTAGSWNNA